MGTINAVLFGLNVFSAPINTCGKAQDIDILGITDGTLNALACPAAEGSPQTVSFSMLIPNEASGLGSLGIMIGGLTTMVPERRAEILELGPRTLIAGTLATLSCGAVVGVLLVLLRAAVRQVALEPHFKWPAAAALVAILQEQ